MSYKINVEALSGIYALPSSVVDKHIKLSGAIQLKVLLLGLKNPAEIDEQKIAEFLSVPLPDVIDALNYWADLGVLESSEKVEVAKPKAKAEKPAKKAVVADAVKPTRDEVAQRGDESPEIAYLLREAQMKFARNLSPNEASTLVYISDDLHMKSSVLLLLMSYAKSEDRLNIKFIEKTAVEWVNDGVTTLHDAEEKIRHLYEMKSAWRVVERGLGIPHRRPSDTEQKYAYKWTCEYGYTTDVLKKAYDACVDATSTFSIPYINKVIEGWHKAGVKGYPDLLDYLSEQQAEKNKKKKEATDSKVTFDMDLFNKSLNDLPE